MMAMIQRCSSKLMLSSSLSGLNVLGWIRLGWFIYKTTAKMD